MESNLERANSRRRGGAKPTGLLAGLVPRNMRYSPADQVAGLPKGRSLMMSTTISKGSLMRCMWFTESMVTGEATGVAEHVGQLAPVELHARRMTS
jgi:hypothetical protein